MSTPAARFFRSAILIGFLTVANSVFALRTSAQGLQLFSTQVPGPFTTVDMATSNIVLSIPIRAKIGANNCTRTCSLNEGAAALLEAIGALVSAVVISELSVAKPNEVPGTRLAAAWTTEKQKTVVKVLVSTYIVVWLVTGLALVILGWVLKPTVPQLASAARAWLGVAIAAAYAYFGISPQ